MVIRENIMINEREFVRSYSDEGRYLLRDGAAYNEAVDPAEYAEERVYTEGDIMPDDDTATVEDYQAALTEMGVSLDD